MHQDADDKNGHSREPSNVKENVISGNVTRHFARDNRPSLQICAHVRD